MLDIWRNYFLRSECLLERFGSRMLLISLRHFFMKLLSLLNLFFFMLLSPVLHGLGVSLSQHFDIARLHLLNFAISQHFWVLYEHICVKIGLTSKYD